MDARDLRRRFLAGLAVLALMGGCASSASPTQVPVSTPGATAAGSATPVPTQIPVPTRTPLAGLTGPIGTGRQIHTSTRLADGRVLIAGGYDASDGALASAVLYDPKSGAFSPTGPLATARGLHTATLLASGRVLITGGGPPNWTGSIPSLASAELYDPTTGTFSPTGSMTSPRSDQTATLLADGRVLIAGGNDIGEHAVASAELFDPKTGTFSPTGSMTTARGFHTATLLADGRVLVTGGDLGSWSYSGPFLASAEIYNPRTGTFSRTGSMSESRAWHAATLLSDGRVLVTGGEDARVDVTSAEIYDPRTGKFSTTGSMTTGRVFHTATLLADGRVLVAGGGSDYAHGNFLASAEIYDPKTGKFSTTGSMADARTYQAATLVADGRVLVTGGYGDVLPLASAEIYDPKTGKFTAAGEAS